jgi:hypothetical protein
MIPVRGRVAGQLLQRTTVRPRQLGPPVVHPALEVGRAGEVKAIREHALQLRHIALDDFGIESEVFGPEKNVLAARGDQVGRKPQ